ncbi:MAG: EAL domain-containing protein [Burkholderiaceae bacterium]
MDLIATATAEGARAALRPAAGRSDGQQIPPRVSTVGSILALTVVSVLMCLVTLMVFLSNVSGRLQVEAEQKNHRFEGLIDGSLAELDVTRPLLGTGCHQAALDVLTQQSLKTRLLDQIHLKDGLTGKICSPIQSPQPAIAAWPGTNGAEENSGVASVGLAASEHGILLARATGRAGANDVLIGEIRTGDLHLHLGHTEDDGYRVLVRSQSGAVLFDSSGLYRPGSHAHLPNEALGLTAQSLVASIMAQTVSEVHPIQVEVMPTPMALVKVASRYLLTAITLAVAFTLVLIALFNHFLSKQISVERRLRIALTRRRFVPVIQPIVDAQTGKCKGGEVLMRWDHPARGLVSPVEFLPVAERLGLMGTMTMIIMERASKSLAALSREHPQMYFSFNVDASQLRDPLFADQLGVIFGQETIRPQQVLLEIVEREAVDEQARVGIDRLRTAGYRIAIDDFGTGQSSLSLLLEIGFDVLKIDQSFVSAVDGNQVNRPVLDAIIDMAQKLDVTTVAEGVETAEQHAFLVAKEVDAIQGYLISKPMLVADFTNWLDQSKHRPPTYSESLDETAAGLNSAAKQLVSHQSTPTPVNLTSEPDLLDPAEHDETVAQEMAANVRHHQRLERISASQSFRARDSGQVFAASPLPIGEQGNDDEIRMRKASVLATMPGDSRSIALSPLSVSAHSSWFMPV